MSMSAIRIAVDDLPEQFDSVSGELTQAIQSAMQRFERPLIGYAQGFLNDWELSQDVVQDTFVKLHRELKYKGSPANLKAWLFTVCRNRSLDILRKNKRVTVVEAEVLDALTDEAQPNPASTAETNDQHARALSFLSRLPENQREVIRLKFQGDLSYKEISEITQLSIGNVGYLLHHGLKRLRELMEAS